MSRRCFFAPAIDPRAATVVLGEQASHHLEHVLRLKTGDPVELRDGCGNAWRGEISGMRKGQVEVRLLGTLDFRAFESPLQIMLIHGLARSDTMDMVVRQATELGVSHLLMFRAARSQYGLSGRQAGKKRERWSRITEEAICQCGRTNKPRMDIFENLESLLDWAAGETGPEKEVLKICAWEREAKESLVELCRRRPTPAAVLAAIGPEGGWDGSEVSSLIDAGFNPVQLGQRILRYETAAVALISSIQLLWGDMGKARSKGVE